MFLTEKKSRKLQLVCDLFFYACRCFTNICKITVHPGNIVGERDNTAEDFWVLFLASSVVSCVMSPESPQDYFVPLYDWVSCKWDALYFSADIVFQATLKVILNGSWWTQMYSKQKQTNKQTRAKPFCNINHMPHTGRTEVLHLLLKVCAGLKVTICHRNALQTWTSGHQSWKFEVTRQSKVVNCSFYSLLAQVYRAFSCLVTRDVSFSPHTWLTDFLHTIQKKMQIKVVFKQNRISFPLWPLQTFMSSTVIGWEGKIKSHSQVA